MRTSPIKSTQLLLAVLFGTALLFGNSEAQNLTPADNYEAFSKLYGYVRWFHPSDEAAEVDWNKFATYGLEQVANAQSPAELKEKLKGLFQPIAPSVQILPENPKIRYSPLPLKPDAPEEEISEVSWVHYGLGNGPSDPIYRSFRSNRLNETQKEEPPFANLRLVLPGEKYLIPDGAAPQKWQVRLSADVKLDEGSEGTGHLWLREDLISGQVGFMDNMDAKPVISTEWQRYSITGNFSSNCLSINLGAFLLGKGGIWVDNFKLEKEDTDGQWVEIPLTNPGFESGRLDDWKYNGLKHKMVLEETGATEGKVALHISTLDRKKEIPAEFQEAGAPFGTFTYAPIGAGLSAIVPTTLPSWRNHTYPRPDKSALDAWNKRLRSYKNNSKSEAGKVAILMTAWNAVQHFHPMKAYFSSPWEEQLRPAIETAMKAENLLEVKGILETMFVPTQDGHFFAFYQQDKSGQFLPSIAWDWVGDKLLVTQVLNENTGLQPGDEILEIEGKSPRKYMEAFAPFIVAGTEGHRTYRLLNRALKGPKDSEMHVKALSAQGKVDISLPRDQLVNTYYNNLATTGEAHRKLDKGIYYVNLSKVGSQEIPMLAEELKNFDKIVFDLRNYPQGNHLLISHLLSGQDTAAHWMHTPRIIQPDHPDHANFEHSGWMLTPQIPHIEAKIAYLTSAHSISFAESMIGLIRHYGIAKTFGSTTAGTNGNMINFRLPGNFTIGFTGMKVTTPAGKRHYGVGFPADFEVKPTQEGLKAGKDEVLDAAVEWLQQ